ncbi:acetate/propionate family kinase [Chelatococcus reniformis]|uniref:Acetate kinase n=1 Tax=Chelatococcus reniformis TaxID=1494448 RepID=A0A916XKX7_9HYPH|nr:acetate/propionate family kinase [Chelatococcus reniformis]GGC79463.1 acetate kinase [Chelatococcus reniformis]
MSNAILVLNAGSSSMKFALYDADTLEPLTRGNVRGIGGETGLDVSGPDGAIFGAPRSLSHHADHQAAIAWILKRIREEPGLSLRAAGHRVVHGGPRFTAPVLVDDAILAQLAALTPLAPAHQPHNLAALRAVAQAWPGLPQVACFDTAFHRTQPRLAQLLPLPRSFADEGVLRYGFHGLSYQHIAETLPDLIGRRCEGRVIVAHLGHGASLCAMRERRSVATTMGFTALDGLMMGTRSGAIDPGLVLYLIQERGMAPAAVAELLNKQSGLLGVSGLSDDVRVLTESGDACAEEALELFAYRAVREAGSLMAALGGLDVLVFTAGIGEHAPGVRAAIASALAWAGIDFDGERNRHNAQRISRDGSAVDVLVIPANEELPIARAVQNLL